MRANRLPVKTVLLFVLVGTLTACGTGPVEPTPPGEEHLIRVDGPAAVTPGGTAQFSATAIGRGVGRDITAEVEWTSLNGQIATVSESGLVTGKSTGATLIRAGFRGLHDLLVQERNVLVLPDGTVAVYGYVEEAGTPSQLLFSANIEVIGGGEALRTKPDPWEATYALYGVPRDAEIEVTAPGFRPARRSVRTALKTTEHAWDLNFTLQRSDASQ